MGIFLSIHIILSSRHRSGSRPVLGLGREPRASRPEGVEETAHSTLSRLPVTPNRKSSREGADSPSFFVQMVCRVVPRSSCRTCKLNVPFDHFLLLHTARTLFVPTRYPCGHGRVGRVGPVAGVGQRGPVRGHRGPSFPQRLINSYTTLTGRTHCPQSI